MEIRAPASHTPLPSSLPRKAAAPGRPGGSLVSGKDADPGSFFFCIISALLSSSALGVGANCARQGPLPHLHAELAGLLKPGDAAKVMQAG